ncbi:MAG TPA: OsmC family protein [Candidatus Dormibacteraeota bacterium]|jgi:putative redox protein|nr:OsmC family protein [Candidatus Dormibacteraeota bacterium]
MQKATARWAGRKVKFVIEAGSGHRAEVDEPPILGDDQGMRPTEMLLGALGACTGINAALLLKKFKQRFRSLAVECEGEQEPDWPHAFTGIEIRFVIGWEEGFTPDDELVGRALDLACNRYCPVDATLTRGTRIGFRRVDA